MRIRPTFLSLTLAAGAALPALTAPEAANPFFAEWKTPFGMPPFREIQDAHFLPALQEGMARHAKEVADIANNPKAPTFANTIEALSDSGEFLTRVSGVFGNLTGAETNDRLQEIQKQVSPLLSKHGDDISLNEALFARVKTIWDGRAALKLSTAQARLLEDTYKRFVRSGALLTADQKQRMRAVNQELSKLGVRFGDNLLKETNGYRLVIERREDLAGLPDGVVAAAAEAATKAGKPGAWVFTLHAPSLWPFLQYAENRALRQQILTAYLTRCDKGDERDNKAVLARIAALRAEKARLLGYPTWADFVLEERMAKNPKGVYGLLDQLWTPALKVARREADELQARIDAEKGGFKLEAWDWRFYAEKVKKAKYDLDSEALRPYFQLDKVRDGAFHVAGKLYGLTFTERKDLPVYHEEVKAFEVKEKGGKHLGIFLVDYHPRPGKRGGAWCSAYRSAWTRHGKRVDPIVVNVCNFSRPTGDKPAMLNLEEVETLFHEFGHGLHGLLYMGRYRGSRVPQDFVELPSQIMEHWALEPQVLKVYATHYQTGKPIPAELVEKIQKSRLFNQGFETVEYLAASKLDMDWHTLPEPKEVDAAAFEKASLDKMGLMPEIPVRYRSPYFNHIVGGYSAGYYSYIWSGVLDNDAFEAFKEKGNIFDPATALSFRKNVLEKGGSEEAAGMYRKFRGRDPKVEPLLHQRGLL